MLNSEKLTAASLHYHDYVTDKLFFIVKITKNSISFYDGFTVIILVKQITVNYKL